MTVGEIVKNRREDLQMTQEELASRIGYRHKTSINKIESGKQKIMQDKILAFAKALQITPEQLMGWEPIVKSSLVNVPLSDAEAVVIKKYRAIDDRGRSNVDAVLDQEYYWSQNHEYEKDVVEYLYLGKVAAAGTEIYPGDIPLERIRERKLNGADFMVGVSGDSMEPTFFDGDRVYVKKTTDIEFGDIGLFIVNGCYYIKEYAPDGLRSHNPNYSLIPKDREIIVVGKVLGKVEK